MRREALRWLAGAGLAWTLAGCAVPPPGQKSAAEAAPPPAGPTYAIQAGDLLTITLAGETDYNQQARVDWNGRIHVPSFAPSGRGEVEAAGLSPSRLAEKLSEFARENKVLVNPRVQVTIAEYVSQAFAVLGQVNLPGRYLFPRGVPPRLSIEEAIAMANGYTRLAKQSGVTVRRGSEIYRVDLKKVAADPGQPSFVVIPGDVITVPERMF